MRKPLTKKKKTVIITLILAFVLICSTVLGCIIFTLSSRKKNDFDFSSLNGSVTKAVLFIGDGMGENHIKNTEEYYGEAAFMTSFNTKGYVTTYSNAVFSPTDSAAAGSALSTGKKFDNGEIARHNGKDVQTISEIAKSRGLGVGIITTDSLSGATPSAFSSHANNRGDEDDIIKGQISSGINLFLGAGKSAYTKYESSFTGVGYTFITDYSNLSAADGKIIGSFSSVVSENGTNASPTLEMLTEFALDYFEENFPDGYFLMIEGAHIDKKSHSNEVFEMMKYLKSFDNSIRLAYNKLQSQNSLLLVTADHETGGLKYESDKNKISNSLYTRSSHSSKNVPYFLHIKPNKPIDVNSVFKKTVDNTDVFKIIRSSLNLV